MILLALMFLVGFVVSWASYTVGEEQGRKFVAHVLSHQLDTAIQLRSTGHIYQHLRVIVDKYL